VNNLNSDNGKKNSTDQVIERSKMLYGFTPAEKSDANEKWMLLNGYFKKRKVKRDKRRRGRAREPGSVASPRILDKGKQ
jgi:hypothetical protein